MSLEKLNKFMSLVLRHQAQEYRLKLDHHGFCSITDLLKTAQLQPGLAHINISDLYSIVMHTPNNRYEIKEEMVRAKYGHSQLKVRYRDVQPPAFLYHGTNQIQVASILSEGLLPHKRSYVHLSDRRETAYEYAKASKDDVQIISVAALAAFEAGSSFYHVGDTIWLTEKVPPMWVFI
ncbi:RNA 2'-phosphotransferase [Bacillus sp. JCM 19041]|uniref:RNA 2'-phosphotransferase n=1 Tax=Bacillus sp. JCM 19041 TaxID=1460637 RepID=UPI0006D1A6AE